MAGGAFERAKTMLVVGNYGELYNRNLAKLIPRGGLNDINQGSTGCISGQGFGALEKKGPLFRSEYTLDETKTKRRGFVSCGVSGCAGFAEFDPATSTWSECT